MLPGCQSTMSVEEAKKITTSFAGSAFVPPPRTIQDVTAILDQQALADAATTAKIRASADQEAPTNGRDDALAEFYVRRGGAARQIGRVGQAIDDFARAIELADRTGNTPLQWWVELAAVELQGGDPSRAADYVRRGMNLVRNTSHRAFIIAFNKHLTEVYLRSGDIDSAQRSLNAAVTVFEETPTSEWSLDGRANLLSAVRMAQAAVASARGQFNEAERHYREAIESDRTRPPERGWVVDINRMKMALTIASQGRLTEAEYEARSALLGALARNGRYSVHVAQILEGLAKVLSRQGRFKEAESLLRTAVDIYEKLGAGDSSYANAQSRVSLGTTLAAQRRWTEALDQFNMIRTTFIRDVNAFARYFSGNIHWALASLETGDVDGARAQVGVALDRNRRVLGRDHPDTAELRALRAMALTAKGEREEALAEFRATAPLLLDRSLRVDDETTTRPERDQRLALILERYIDLLADIKGTALEARAAIDGTAEAFRLAEAVRGRRVQSALDASAARAVAPTPALADLVRREQDARKQISALEAMLVNTYSVSTDRQSAKIIDGLRTQLATLRRARQALVDQIQRDFPTYAALVDPAPVTVEQARDALRPGEALIATLVTDEKTYVWAVRQRGELAFAAVPITEKILAEKIALLRRTLDPRAKTLGEIPAFDVETAHELYRTLLEPVKRGWEGADTVLIVGHGPLGQLPFALLPTARAALADEHALLFSNYRRVPWLIRRHAVTTLPSVSALVTLRRAPAGPSDRRPFVGFGDPYFSAEQAREATAERVAAAPVGDIATRSYPLAMRDVMVSPTAEMKTSKLAMLPRLPDTAEEIRSIARMMNAEISRDVFLGAAANEQTVKRLDLAKYRVIAFATHGLVPGDIDGLTQPALALTAPEVAKIEGDGLLAMEEILALRLDADWVVLSACNTANGAGTGAEAISGLGRAFFYAGARALLVTHWPVETTSARALATELFRRQAVDPTLTRAKALQQTMNAVIDDGGLIDPVTRKVIFSYAHPIFWAPFALVGDGG